MGEIIPEGETRIIPYGDCYVIARNVLGYQHYWNSRRRRFIDGRDIHAPRARAPRASYFRSAASALQAYRKASANGWA